MVSESSRSKFTKLEFTNEKWGKNPTVYYKATDESINIIILEKLLSKCGRYLTVINHILKVVPERIEILTKYCSNLTKLSLYINGK